jgi:uncharacterized protein YggE
MSARLLVAASAVVALLCACGTQPAPLPDITSSRQITVTGTGVADAEPDVATIIFGVDVTSSEPDTAVSQAADLMNSGLAVARDMGVAGEDFKTYSYSLWIENLYDPITYQTTGERVYHVSQYESVDVRDMTKVGDVLAGVVSAGINSVSSVSYGVEDQAALQSQAREAAIVDARQKAEAIAAGLGVQLGGPLSVSEFNAGYTYYDQTAQYNYGAGGYGESAPPITPGSFTVSTSVTVTLAIQ